MCEVRANFKGVMTIVLAFACAILAILWPRWKDELRAQSYYFHPETVITQGPSEGSAINSADVTFIWTGNDDMTPVSGLVYSFKIDQIDWSSFSSDTTHLFSGLSEGNHSFSVKARDLAGNEDPSPATRNFSIDTAPPSPASDFRGSSSQTGIRLDWTHSPSPDIHSYRLYWDNGTGVINYDAAIATISYPSNSFNIGIFNEGFYHFGLRAVDKAGNEEKNTTVVASVFIAGFNVTISLESSTYDRGQDVPVRGTVTHTDDTPIVNIPVTIDIESKGFHRYYTAYTNTTGEFRYTFQPLATEAGTYTARAKVMYEGLEKTASSTFKILGLILKPASLTLDMSMNSSKTVNLTLQNIGDIAITGIQYGLTDNAPTDSVTGNIDVSSLPSAINAGDTITVPVIFTTDPGTPPASSAVFTAYVNSAEGSAETTIVTLKLYEAISVPKITPDPLIAGVRIGSPVTKTATVTNEGFASMNNTIVSIHDPETYNWITIVNGEIGTIHPLEARDFQIYIDPPSDLTLGNYVVQLDLSYNGIIKTEYLTVQVTTATSGQVAFKVYDDTGSVVPNAEVNLISKEFYINVTPQGSQEYNNVIKGNTDAQGYILFEDVPVGEYRYLVNAVKHDQKKGEITVEPGTTPQTIKIIMVTNLVDIDFSVTPTTIQDEYTVTLNITYATHLTKPALYAYPSTIALSFFPEEVQEGTITITNTSNNAPVRNILIDATQLDPIDQEVAMVFGNGLQTMTIETLGPKETVQIAFRASIPNGITAKLNNRNLGNIIASGEYTFSLEGEAFESTTTTPIPVLYWRPQDLSLPSVSYVNDELDGNLNDLEYQGNTYRLTVKSNRDMTLSSYGPLKAISHANGGPDSESIINSNNAFWNGDFNRTEPLTYKGDVTTFDILGLEETLEDLFINDGTAFLNTQKYLGFFGQWSDRGDEDAYLIPISITTIRPNEIISGGGGCSSCWFSSPPSLPIEHGEVKLQIEQKVTLERQAFDAKMSLKPTVPSLNDVTLRLKIKDKNGDDASSLFFVIVTQKSGISSLEGGTITGPADINGQLIPSSEAGGTSPEGLEYDISASVEYSYDGNAYSYNTQEETVTVKPMPKLVLDYYLPYVVMANKPVKIKVRVTNQGAGPAHNLVIFSAQPKIVENINNIPVSFFINGSSSTPSSSSYQNGELTINFGDVPAGGTVEGYWLLTSTKDGYFVEFTATLKHEDYLGIQLDPLIQEVITNFVPAIGGIIQQSGVCLESGFIVQVWQGSILAGQDTVDETGRYFISDLVAGNYLWVVKNLDGNEMTRRDITVLGDQPTSTINETVNTESIDTDNDGMPDCWELRYFGDLVQNADDDYDHDGLTNLQEYQIGTDPTTPNVIPTQRSDVFGFNNNSPFSADPVNTATGNYVYQRKDFDIPGIGIPAVFERTYNSQDPLSGPLGYGWNHTYNAILSVNSTESITVRWGDGKTETWTSDGLGGYTPQNGVFDSLIDNGDDTYTLKKKDLTQYTFVSSGKLLSIVDKNGNTISLVYTVNKLSRIVDAAGRNIDLTTDNSSRITTITDPIGRTVQFTYDIDGNLASVADLNGNMTTYTYDSNHQLLTVVDPRGNTVVTNTYDDQKRVVTCQRDAKMGETTYTYDEVNRMTTIVDQLGYVTIHYHDVPSRLIQTEDALGNSTYYSYDLAGNRTEVEDKNGNITRYTYDSNGNVTSKDDALNNLTTITYDANNNPLTRTDALGNTTVFEYDTNSNLIKTTDPVGYFTTTTYTVNGQPSTVTDARGNMTTFSYDSEGNLIEITDALANKTTYTYDGVGRRLSVRDALNRITIYSYDNNNNLLSVTDTLGNISSYTYDGNNNKLSSTDPMRYTTEYSYDVKDLLTTITDPIGNTITNTYDALDRKTSVIDKRGKTTTYAYDAVGNLISVTDSLGNITTYAYDANGNKISETNPLNQTTSYTYDALNRIVSVTDPLGNITTNTYDALGRVTSTTNAKGQLTNFQYDSLGRLIKVTDANGGQVNYIYDGNGNRLTMTEPNGNTTSYTYDTNNRLTQKVEPLGSTYQYGYDAVGNSVNMTDPNGNTIVYSYDGNNRLVTITYPDLSTVTLTYDANGNRIQMSDKLGISSFTYDALSQLTSYTDPFGKTVGYAYDASGNKSSMTYPDGKIVNYSYDSLNRLSTVTDWLSGTTSYTYDAAGNLLSTVNPNNTSAAYTYDAAGRLTALSNLKSDASVISNYSYTLDAIGNHMNVTQNEPLAPVLSNKNIAYSYDAENRLTSAGGIRITFDNNGNMITRGTDSFSYDFNNRLIQSSIGGLLEQYSYDGIGNRLAKTVDDRTVRYILDRSGSLSNVLAETDSNGTITTYYVYGLGLISKILPDNTAYYYHYDSRGSAIALTDVSQNVTDSYAYNSFGSLANLNGSTSNPFKYVGRYGVMEEGNGLSYIRARYYVPELGRFITKDRLWEVNSDSQELNKYIYTLNNPAKLIDVSGLNYVITDDQLNKLSSQARDVASDFYDQSTLGVEETRENWNRYAEEQTASWNNNEEQYRRGYQNAYNSYMIIKVLRSENEYLALFNILNDDLPEEVKYFQSPSDCTRASNCFFRGYADFWRKLYETKKKNLQRAYENIRNSIMGIFINKAQAKTLSGDNEPYIPEIYETQSYKKQTFKK